MARTIFHIVCISVCLVALGLMFYSSTDQHFLDLDEQRNVPILIIYFRENPDSLSERADFLANQEVIAHRLMKLEIEIEEIRRTIDETKR